MYAERVQATEWTQAASIGSQIQMREHGRNAHEPSSPTGRAWGRGSVEQVTLSRANGRGRITMSFPA